MFSETVVALLSLCCMLVSCTVTNIHLKANQMDNKCGKKEVLGKDDEATIFAHGQIPGAECEITFETTDCGVCFQFEKYALFNTSLASLSLTVDTMEKMSININSTFPMQYVCSDKKTLMVKITHKQGYEFNAEAPGYTFILDVYNKCGYRGTAKSVSFADVYKHAKGYHHGEEAQSREMATLITGLVVGLCLASVFLVVLAIGYCYVKNSPNRGASKSAGMPRVGGGRGNMNVQSGQGQNKPEVEMVAYKAKEGDRPEGKPLLTGAAAATGGQ